MDERIGDRCQRNYCEYCIELISITYLDGFVYVRIHRYHIDVQLFHMSVCILGSVLLFYLFMSIIFWIYPTKARYNKSVHVPYMHLQENKLVSETWNILHAKLIEYAFLGS